MKINKTRYVFYSIISMLIGLLSAVFADNIILAKSPEAFPIPTLTGNPRDDIIIVAESQVGYCEEPVDQSVYGDWANQSGRAWCSEFASWCGRQAGMPEELFGVCASTYMYKKFFGPLGRFYIVDNGQDNDSCDCKEFACGNVISFSEIEKGDILLVSTNSSNYKDGPNHTAIAVGVSGGYVNTIEGNFNNSVTYFRRPASQIHGVCKPEYEYDCERKGHILKEKVVVATCNVPGEIVTECKMCEYKTSKVIYSPKTVKISEDVYAYDACPCKPIVTVVDSNGKTIPPISKINGSNENINYTVSYSNNTSIGTATVNVYFKGNYSGSLTKTFKIIPKKTSISAPVIASDGITVKWNKNTTGAGYYIYRSVNGASYTKIKTITNNATVSWKDTTAKTNGNKYQYRIVAYKTVSGITYKSVNSSVKTIYFLTRPTVTLANQSSAIRVSWGKNAKATGYYVYKSTDSGKTYKKIKTITSNSTVSYTDTAAKTNGNKYQYKVVAYKTVSGTTYKSEASAIKTMYFVSRPAILSATNSAAGKLLIKWSINAKATGYQVQYSTSSSFTSPKLVTATGTTSTLSKTISSLTKGKTYYVRIRSYKTVGNTKFYSTWSSSKSIKITK